MWPACLCGEPPFDRPVLVWHPVALWVFVPRRQRVVLLEEHQTCRQAHVPGISLRHLEARSPLALFEFLDDAQIEGASYVREIPSIPDFASIEEVAHRFRKPGAHRNHYPRPSGAQKFGEERIRVV